MSGAALLIGQQRHSTATPVSGVLQRKCAGCGNHTTAGGECKECGKKRLQTKLQVNEPGDIYEQEADRIADQVLAAPADAAVRSAPPRIQRFSGQSNGQMDAAPASVVLTLANPGRPLEPTLRRDMESRFGHDFSKVRVHTDATAERSARDVNAQAYTAGREIVFGAGRFAPGASDGRQLLAHELAHVVQQSDGATVRRLVEFRDVGKGQASGFARLPELIDRLNAISRGLTFSVVDRELHSEPLVGATLSNFDQQMVEFIDQDPVIPFRMTNSQALLGTHAGGFHDRVLGDHWESGYVDIDDLLASSDLGLQTLLVHFLRERSATRNYARRIGSPSLDTQLPGPEREFNRVHALGVEAEVQVLRDFFGDPTIRFIPGAEGGNIGRVFRNSRRDRILARVRTTRGVDAISIEVVTRDRQTHTAEEYLRILEAERVEEEP